MKKEQLKSLGNGKLGSKHEKWAGKNQPTTRSVFGLLDYNVLDDFYSFQPENDELAEFSSSKAAQKGGSSKNQQVRKHSQTPCEKEVRGRGNR